MSALLPLATIERTSLMVRFVPSTGPTMRSGSRANDLAQLDVGFLHHLAPTLHLVFDEGAEFFRRVRPAVDVELLEALFDVRCADRFVDRAVEGAYDCRRRAM